MSVTLVYADHELVLLVVQLGPLEEIHDSKLPIRLSTQFFVIIVGLRNEGHVWQGVNHVPLVLQVIDIASRQLMVAWGC